MLPTESVTYQTPDKVERPLRFTLGARKRIAEIFKQPDIRVILQQYGDGSLTDIAYCMMFDENGDPPPNLSLKKLAEGIDDSVPLLAAVMSAISKGASPKNELEALLRKAQEMEAEKWIGSISGLLPDSASELLPPSSGVSQSENSTPSVTDSATESESSITEAA